MPSGHHYEAVTLYCRHDGSQHKVKGHRAAHVTQGQSLQQAYNLYNKLILALTITLTITNTGGAVLTLMLGYSFLKLRLALTLNFTNVCSL